MGAVLVSLIGISAKVAEIPTSAILPRGSRFGRLAETKNHTYIHTYI
jgi:hypothetical protein